MASNMAAVPEEYKDALKWPDFSLRQSKETENVWIAYTDTGRPRTPVFVLWFYSHGTEGTAKVMARMMLNDAFEKAHPNGCPGRNA